MKVSISLSDADVRFLDEYAAAFADWDGSGDQAFWESPELNPDRDPPPGGKGS